MALPGEKPELNVVGESHQHPVGGAAPLHPPTGQGGAALTFYLEAISEGKWIIAGTLVVALLVLGWVVGNQTPMYEADILLQIESGKQGTGAGIPSLDGPGAGYGFGQMAQVATEIEVMQSRQLLANVVDELHLDIHAAPRYFPRFGRLIAHYRDGKVLASPLFGAPKYAWGGERIKLSRFDVPAEMDNQTITLTLVAREPGFFTLRDSTGKTVAAGEVGKPVSWTISGPTEDGTATVFIQELRARPGTEFHIVKTSRANAARALAGSLKIVEKAKFTGVLRVSTVASTPAHAVAVLNAFAGQYLRQNVEKRSDEAERTLKFLETQIPLLREKVDIAESALEKYKTAEGNAGVDLTLATTSTLQRSADLEKRLSEMELARKEMLHRFMPTHPAVLALNEKVAFLAQERAAVDMQISQLPEAEARSLRLKRDVAVASGLYLALLNRAQEIRIAKAGLVGNVRILDPAITPSSAVNPKRDQKVGVAIAAGLLAGVLLAVGRKVLSQGLVDPTEAERATGIIVRASIPHSDRLAVLEKERKKARQTRHPILAQSDPTDMAAEAIRSLRTSLQFALMDAASRVIAVGGPRPGVGKSFVTVNLARVFADAGKRVLLLDADLRKGSLHGYLGIHRTPGLAEAISGTISLSEVLHQTDLPGIDFIPRGSAPTNPSELLGSERFRHMVENLAAEYDLVLIDLPPILAVTDAALVGRVAGVNLLVLRAGWHPIRELQQAVKAYAENGVRLSGIVFNDVMPRKGGMGAYSYAYQYQYHYQYAYKPKDKEEKDK